MSITSLAILFKFFSIAGIANQNTNCPTAGTVLSEYCAYVYAQDASGASVQTSALERQIANGSCGYTVQTDAPVIGVCGHPPYGWSANYTITGSVYVSDIYWSHPQNPLVGQLAHSAQSYVTGYTNEYYTTYPDTNTAGWQRNAGETIAEINGIDGWRLVITYTGDGFYSYIEDDLTP